MAGFFMLKKLGVDSVAILRICPRCNAIVKGECQSCKDFYKKRHREYDKRFRNKKNQDFYNSDTWKISRENVMSYHGGLDIYQLIVNKRKVSADAVHHIKELNDAWELRSEFSNLIPLSDSSHMLIHSLYKRDKVGTQQLLSNCLMAYKKLIGD